MSKTNAMRFSFRRLWTSSSCIWTIFQGGALQGVENDGFINAVEELRIEDLLSSVWILPLMLSKDSPTVSAANRVLLHADLAVPRLLVMMTTVFLKSTARPRLSVKPPSSRICSMTLKISGCAFSISSKSTTL